MGEFSYKGDPEKTAANRHGNYFTVGAMPRDPNGKLYKRTLRDPYWVGRERAI
jgi:hypothetical protein